MILFPRYTITIYRYIKDTELDMYDTPKLTYEELGSYKCDFQTFTAPLDEETGYGLVDTGILKVYISGNVTDDLKLWGDCFFIIDDDEDRRYVILSRPHYYSLLDYTLILAKPDLKVREW